MFQNLKKKFIITHLENLKIQIFLDNFNNYFSLICLDSNKYNYDIILLF